MGQWLRWGQCCDGSECIDHQAMSDATAWCFSSTTTQLYISTAAWSSAVNQTDARRYLLVELCTNTSRIYIVSYTKMACRYTFFLIYIFFACFIHTLESGRFKNEGEVSYVQTNAIGSVTIERFETTWSWLEFENIFRSFVGENGNTDNQMILKLLQITNKHMFKNIMPESVNKVNLGLKGKLF